MVATILWRRHLFAFCGGFLVAMLLATSLALWLVLPHAATPHANAAHGPASFLPSNPSIHSSAAREAAQYFLHDHLAQTLATRQRLSASSPHSGTRVPLFTAPGGALSFNSDTSAIAQNSESFAIDPTTTGSQTGMIGVGGFADYRGFLGFFKNGNTGSGYAVSQNVSCAAGTCASLIKDGWIPGIEDPLCTDFSVLVPEGDPSVAVDANGTFYYAALVTPGVGVGGTCALSQGDTGILIAKSNANLKNPAASCFDSVVANMCWSSVLVHETSQSGCAPSTTPCALDDRPSITVDPTSGAVYAAWDYADQLASIQYVDITECGLFPACSVPVKTSVPPPGCPVLGTCDNTFAPNLAIWHNPVTNANNAVLSYVQFNSVTGNTDLHLADLATADDDVFLSLPPDQVVLALSSTQFSITTQVKVAADARNIPSPHIYVTWEQCRPVGGPPTGADYYFQSFGIGACAQSVVKVKDFTSVSGSGTGISVLGGFNQFFPSLAVDEVGATAGHVALAYYSTQGDGAASALIRPYVATSTGGATPSGFNAATYQAVLTGNFRYSADPFFALSNVPAMGDYLQVATANGAIFVHFNGTYEQKTGPAFFGTVPVNQSDNYLCYIQPTTAISMLGDCSSA